MVYVRLVIFFQWKIFETPELLDVTEVSTVYPPCSSGEG